jgi:2,6-dihydroxypseudooxynicotine hydrolase
VVLGSSLGGYYAPRAAAFEWRVKACVGNCGPYDWSECFEGLPRVTREAYQHYSGASNMEEALELSKSMTLAGAAERITCPLLVLHGQQDPLIPWQQGQRIVDEPVGQKRLSCLKKGFIPEQYPYKSNPLASDWLAEQLGGVIV